MFQMRIEDAIKIGNNISVGGSCENKMAFTNKLIDNFGNEYDTYIPLGKELVINENSIVICFKGDYDVNLLKGRTLKSKI